MIWALWHGALSCWKSSIIRWYTVVIKGWTWVSNNTQVGCRRLTDAQLVLSEPKCAQENIPTPLPPTSLNRWRTRQGWIHAFMFFTQIWPNHLNVAAEIETHQIRQRFPIFYCPTLESLFPVLIWQERHPVWSSAAVVHLLQGSTCCVFRDGILHTLVNEWLFELLLPFYHL